MTWNLPHLARILRQAGGIPAYGNQRTEWEAGGRSDFENRNTVDAAVHLSAGSQPVRHRDLAGLPIMAISISDLESVAAGGWRATEQARLGDWLLRSAEGFTGRANSALPVGDPGLPLPDAVDEVVRWYTARNLPPMVAVPYPSGDPGGSAVSRLLDGRGWTARAGAAIVMTAGPGAIPPPAGAAADVRVDIDPEPDDGWMGLYHYRGQDLPPIARTLLLSAPWQAFASVREQGETIAVARIAEAGGWAGYTAVEVSPAHRRRGLASAITWALAQHAASRVTGGYYLQVEERNTGARTLYERAGFTDHHGYHYRIAP
jgi:N-acetylglutamate synthase